jgi:hypothetical protein
VVVEGWQTKLFEHLAENHKKETSLLDTVSSATITSAAENITEKVVKSTPPSIPTETGENASTGEGS